MLSKLLAEIIMETIISNNHFTQIVNCLSWLNTLAPRLIQAVCKKNSWIARGFAWEYLRSCTGYGPGRSVKRRGKQVFCEWCHKWRTFRPPWPTSPGPWPKLLDVTISVKFLLDSMLHSGFWYFGW